MTDEPNLPTKAEMAPKISTVPFDLSQDVFEIDSPRLRVLWRLAYAVLRLDQVPSGGWGKTLANWMEQIWEGDNGTIGRNPKMRKEGGTDLTTYAFYSYCQFLDRLFLPGQMALLLQVNGVANRVYDNFKGKVNFEGAVGGKQTRSDAPDVRIRHTLMGLITFLLYGKANEYGLDIQEIISLVRRYLIERLTHWRHDETHWFAMMGAALKLQEMLSLDIAQKQLTTEQIEHLQIELARHIPDMIAEVSRPLNYDPNPPETIHGPLRGVFFFPYYHFWRMERTGFLMYFPFLLTENGESFLPQVTPGLQGRCAQIFSQLLNEIELPYDPSAASNYLIRYHRDPDQRFVGRTGAPRDWSLSAELAVLLKTKAVRDLIISRQVISEENFERKRRGLHAALLQTFDSYHTNPENFKFMNGPTFSQILHLFDKDYIPPEELKILDEAINRLCARGVTEQGIRNLVTNQICLDADERAAVDTRALKNFLVAKLESGEYTPDEYNVCNREEWERRTQEAIAHSTIDFYDSPRSDKYIARYAPHPELNLIDETRHRFDWSTAEKRIALDVGCGAGQYAELLAQMGFDVKLMDASKKMLALACERVGLPADSFRPSNIFDVSWGYEDAYFDLIFASAIMIHAPKSKRVQVYAMFHRLLKPDGVLFANYKIGDHTLISEDGRFFAYYRDQSEPEKELKNNGFRVEAMVLNTNYKNMYSDPKQIQWVNFYCRKV